MVLQQMTIRAANGASEEQVMGQQAQARMAVGVRQIGPQRKEKVSGAKISGTCKKSSVAKKSQSAQDLQVPDGGERQGLVLEPDTEKALDTLAILWERFDEVNGDLADVDRKLDKEFEEMEEAWARPKKHKTSWR